MIRIIFTFQIIIIILIFIFILINSIPSFYKNIHPLIFTIILIIFNIFISMNLSTFRDRGWWSFILFIIIVGRIIILFLYFTRFINNMNLWTNLFFEIKKLRNFSNNSYIIDPNNIINIYSYNINYRTLLSVIYLLISLTLIVKIILINKFTLRKIN